MKKVRLVMLIVVVALSIALSIAMLAVLAPQLLMNDHGSVPTPTPSSSVPTPTPSSSVPTPTPSSSVPTPTPLPSSTPSDSANGTSQEQLSIFDVQFIPQSMVVVYLVNSGDKDVTIYEIFVYDDAQTDALLYCACNSTVRSDSQAMLSFNFDWQTGESYEVRLVTANGESVTYSATVP